MVRFLSSNESPSSNNLTISKQNAACVVGLESRITPQEAVKGRLPRPSSRKEMSKRRKNEDETFHGFLAIL
jgi:hypothetical protein